MNKIKLFTHNDLDGVGCATLAKVAFKEVEIEFCGYNDVNEKVKEFITNTSLAEYENVFITDISVNEEVAAIVNEVYRNFSNIRLLDHHKTAEWLNKYDWATVKVLNQSLNEEGYLESETSLFHDYQFRGLHFSRKINEFINLVRQYDTWEWKCYGIQKAKDLNDVMWLVGKEDFVDIYTKILKNSSIEFEIAELHTQLLKYKRKEIESYIDSKLKLVKIFEDEKMNKVAFVVADNNISELGSKICEEYKEVDYCCIYTGFNMSLRSIGEFDVSEIAKRHAGGGHKNASGMPVVKSYIDKYLLV